jgi:hypothetical protein
LQAEHADVHGRSQQTPSTHDVEAHSPPAPHFAPFSFTQAPPVLQVPLQLSGSTASTTGAQAPGVDPRLHAWHVPQLAAAQQTPSTQ